MTETASSARRRPDVVLISRTFRWPCLLVLAAMLCGFPVARNLRAQAPKPTEYEVEAAYLSNFGRFVEWPARAGAASGQSGAGPSNAGPFYVCVLGQDPFGSLLDAALKGETIGAAPIVAKRIAGPEEAAGCRILFVSSSKDSQLNAILAALGTSNILTVGEMPGFTRRGGMIQFVVSANRVRFEINLTAAQRAGLTLSSELLKVAVAIRRTP
jgi:hypothetical protein